MEEIRVRDVIVYGLSVVTRFTLFFIPAILAIFVEKTSH